MKLIHRAATFAPTSWNEKDRTIDVRFTGGGAVQRIDAKGPYVEKLDMGGMDLSRFIGASVLNSHRQSSLGDILGVVLKATKDGIATLQLSAREDVAPFVADIAAGVIRHLSIGYSVQQWRESIDPKSGVRTKVAARWTPVESSFVPVPADFGATTRSNPMKKKAAGAVEASETDVLDTETVEPQTITRNAAIRNLCRSAQMSQTFTDALIDGEGDVLAARASINDEMQRRSAATPPIRTQVGVQHDNPAAVLERRIEAQHARHTGAKPSDAARAYMGETLLDIARASLRSANISIVGLTADETFQRAATHGTSDFPELLTGVGRRTLLSAYAVAASPIKTICRASTAVDFRTKSALRISGAGLLEEMTEHGEFKSTTRSETKESYALRTFGRMFGVSRKALINDDLGAFNDMASRFGIAAAQTEADQLVTLLESNPNLDDGDPVFDQDHNNTDPDASPISVESVSDARLAMRSLTDDDGTLISAAPRYLLVPPLLETAAQIFLASITPARGEDVQPFTFDLLVEPRLSGSAWYLAADPASVPCIEYAHLAGASGPVIESRPAWTTLGLEVRAFLDFGAGFIGRKGLYKFADGDSN